MMEPADTAGGSLRAHLRLGAATLGRHQLAVFLALGCERIVCLTQRRDDDMLALQAAAEAVGAKFHIIAEPQALLGLITAIDELVALADGLLAWPRTAIPLLEAGPGVIVQSVEAGVAAGFERLDLNHADAGALRMPGRLVDRLAELPSDCNAFSALQRIALQAGLPQRMLPAAALGDGHWLLVRSEAEAHAAEALWIRLQTQVSGHANATLAAAQYAVRRLGPALLHAGSGNLAVAAAGVVTAMLALVAGRFHWPATAFILAGIAWVLFVAAALLARVEREDLHSSSTRILRGIAYGWVMDGVLAVLMIQCTPFLAGQNLAGRAFAPVMLIGLCRYLPQTLAAGWARWLEDRGALALFLAIFSAFGLLDRGVEALAVLVLALGLLETRRPSAPPENG